MSDFWKKEISEKLSLPCEDDQQTSLHLNFGELKHNNKYSKQFFHKDLVLNNLTFNDVDKININEETKKLNESYNKSKNKILNNNKLSEKQKETKIKTLDTKLNRNINNINKVTKSLKVYITPNDKQIKILNDWFKECEKVYNYCVDCYNNNFINKKEFNQYKILKIKIFNQIYSNNEKGCPYDILTDEVRIFCSNLKSCMTNFKNGNISHYQMKYRDTSKSHSIFIPKSSLDKTGFYLRHLSKMNGFEKIKININDINDFRLIKDNVNKKYYITLPYQSNIMLNDNKMNTVALDCGEKIFQAFYSPINYGHIGINMRKEILQIEKKIKRYQRVFNNKKNDRKVVNNKRLIDIRAEKIKEKYKLKNKIFNEKKIRNNSLLINKKNIKNKIQKCYTKIKNKVKELHNKTALYLVRNYKNIMIPVFETQNMLKNKKYTKEYFNNLIQEKGEEECKKEVKQVYKKRRLNKRVKFVLNNLSHYKFRQHLTHKCEEYGSKLHIVTEEYTSKTCTNCGEQSSKYNSTRVKQCICGHKMDRDINGARNIFIKNIEMVARSWVTIQPKECEKVNVINEQFITNCNNK